MPKAGFSCATIEETQYLIKKPRAEVREEKKWGVEFPGHKKVKAAMERQPAMIRQNYTDGCFPCHNGTPRDRQGCWRRKGTGAAPPVRRWHLTPDPTPSSPGIQPAPSGPINGTRRWRTDNLRDANADSHVPLPRTQPVNLDALAEDSILDEEFDPKLVTGEEHHVVSTLSAVSECC